MKNNEDQYNKMIQTKTSWLVTSLAIPTIISMLVSSLYNMADTYYVSKLGTSASGAVGIVFSVMAIIQAIGFTLGMGSGSQISRLLGQKDDDKATMIASSGFSASFIIGVIICIIGIVFVTPIMKLLGSTKTIMPYSVAYSRYIFYATPIMASSFVMNNILRSEGKAKFAMIGIATGGILNIFLDPLFIFVLDYGIAGAAIATALCQLISFVILLVPFVTKKTITRINPKFMSLKLGTYGSIVKNGMPSLCRQGLSSIGSVLFNIKAAVYGDAAVAAMAIIGKVFMVILSICLGYGQGFQPVCGYNYGAKRTDRVKEAILVTIRFGVVIMTLLGIVCFIYAPNIIRWFIEDDFEVIKIGTEALRAYCFSMPFVPVCIVANMTFQSIGRAWMSTFLSSLRQGIFFVPCLIVLPYFFGLEGIEYTRTVADILSFFVCLPIMISFIKKLEKAAPKS